MATSRTGGHYNTASPVLLRAWESRFASVQPPYERHLIRKRILSYSGKEKIIWLANLRRLTRHYTAVECLDLIRQFFSQHQNSPYSGYRFAIWVAGVVRKDKGPPKDYVLKWARRWQAAPQYVERALGSWNNHYDGTKVILRELEVKRLVDSVGKGYYRREAIEYLIDKWNFHQCAHDKNYKLLMDIYKRWSVYCAAGSS